MNDTASDFRKIFITGHRSPDVDSLAAAAALAELRRRQSDVPIQAVCCGPLPERVKYLFDRFHLPYPESRSDIYLRIGDVMKRDLPVLSGQTTLFDAVSKLHTSGYSRLPVVRADGSFAGMLSPLALLEQLLNTGSGDEGGLTGRLVKSSIALIANVIGAKVPQNPALEEQRDFLVYVAAMSMESFEKHIPEESFPSVALIVGDRAEIQLRALQKGVPLLIVTGSRPIDPQIQQEAACKNITILKTKLDSATVIRRLKFSVPVESCCAPDNGLQLRTEMRLHGLENRILNQTEDVIPVVSGQGGIAGAVLKSRVRGTPPYRLIMVDHNEEEQSIPGAAEIPVIEVVDHHRIGMMPTTSPIKFTGDIVGSTCTLVADMFRSSGESLSPEWAGLLLGGIAADTLNLKSPTTTARDCRMLEWLEKLSGVKAAELMDGFASLGSLLADRDAQEVIDSDRKDYFEHGRHFSLSQVEENNLARFHRRREELFQTLSAMVSREKSSFAALLVTDPVRGNSELLFAGEDEVLHCLPFEECGDHLFSLPGVLSRKKQLLPQFLAVLSQLANARI